MTRRKAGKIKSAGDTELISSPLTLPNGRIVPNRLVKAAMAEGIGLGGGLPRKGHMKLYERWGQGGWGMIISGNVQIDPGQLASPHDLTMPDIPEAFAAYKALAKTIHSSAACEIGIKHDNNPNQTLAIMQLSHPGLQSSSTLNLSRLPWKAAIGPCSDRPRISDSWMGWLWAHAIWPTRSRKITNNDEWLNIVKNFVRAAKVAEKSGWDGVQIHSAHGYLLAEYLSPLTNPDPKPLPDVLERIPLRLHLLYLILRELRENTSRSFIKGVKVNCSDFAQGGLDEGQATAIIQEIVSWNLVDFIEVSGGTYSNPAFAAPEKLVSSSQTTEGSIRQSLFAHFTSSLLPTLPSPPDGPAIMLTGGLHDRSLIASSLKNACDLVGIGRPACLYPTLPRDIILNTEVEGEYAKVGGYPIPGGEMMRAVLGGSTRGSRGGIPLVGAGVSTLWHEWQMCRLGRGVEPDLDMHWIKGLMVEEGWYEVLKGGPWGWWSAWRGE